MTTIGLAELRQVPLLLPVVMYAVTTLLVGCASFANTPAQDVAWSASKKCDRPGINVTRIEPDGRVWATYDTRNNFESWSACIAQARLEVRRRGQEEQRRCVPGGKRTYGLVLADLLAAFECGEGRAWLSYHEGRATDLERGGARGQAARHYRAAGHAAHRLGEYQRAVWLYLRALDLLDSAGEPPIEALGVLEGLGTALSLVGDLANAERYFERGRQVADTIAGPGRFSWSGIFTNALGNLAWRQRDFFTAVARADSATRFFETFLAQLSSGPEAADSRRYTLQRLSSSQMLAGRAERRLWRFEAAEKSLRRALEFAREARLIEQEARSLQQLGWLALDLNDSSRALDHFQQAWVLASKVANADLEIWAPAGMAQAMARTGQFRDAIAANERALELLESLRGGLTHTEFRGGFVEDKQEIYHNAVRLTLAIGQPDRAFGYAERARARAFLDLLGSQVLSRGQQSERAQEERTVHELRREAEALTEEAMSGDPAVAASAGVTVRSALRDVAVARHRQFVERLKIEDREQASLMTVEPVSLEEVQQFVPEGTTVLEYLVTNDETIVWVIDRTGVEVVRLPRPRSLLVAAVAGLRRAIGSLEPLEEVQREARWLHDNLVGPIRPHIRSSRLIIVPHDVLHYIPFAALRTPGERWLVEDYAITTVPSASVLKYLGTKGRGASPRALVVGNPDAGVGRELPWAEREARAVGEIYRDASVLLRRDATETNVKRLSGEAGLLHFATHGDLREDDPLASALLLTPDGRDDGRLEVREIFRLELNARLVVLSACETGLGKLSRGDELVSLQRAFLYAGTPAVISTLWKVEDRATYELMRAFYSGWSSGGVADALRGAQLRTMANHPHPFFWAGFVLSGAGE